MFILSMSLISKAFVPDSSFGRDNSIDTVKFIPRNDFLAFLKDNVEAALRVAQQLGETYHMAIGKMCAFGLSHSAGEKLARFLLQLVGNFPEDKGQVGLKLALTYEEIGGLIGLSRETVTRLLADFRKNQWLQVTGSH